jgi:hypothetical protein
MAKVKDSIRKKELKTAIDVLGKLSGYEEVVGSEILRTAFEKLELGLRREFMDFDVSSSSTGKKEV